MEIRGIFSALGIEPTKDAASIKKAYREKLREANPEENPEGFKRLREAYEEACAYAARSEEDAKEEREKRDDSPSGRWLERCRNLYDDFQSRLDIRKWEELFADEIFQSLEEEENCRIKFLCLLMSHFHLPTDVWKLLDRKLNIVNDAGRLREMFRADFVYYLCNKCEQGENFDYALLEGEPDAQYELFLNHYDECWQALRRNEQDKAVAVMAAADELRIYHPAMEILRVKLLMRQEKKQEALDLVAVLLEKHRGNDMVRYNAAEAMWRLDRQEESAALYEELKAETDDHYMANLRLTEWYYSHAEYAKAKKCAEKALRGGVEDDFMELLRKINRELEKDYEKRWEEELDWEAGMELGWCWLQDGSVARGIQLAEELDQTKHLQELDKIAGCNDLLTKLYMEEAEYEAALYMTDVWEKSLEEKLHADESEEDRQKDRNKIREVKQFRVECLHQLGFHDNVYFRKALEEIARLESEKELIVPLLVEKTQIYLDMGEYELCREAAERLIVEYQEHTANVPAMKAYRKEWNAAGVLRCARQCIHYYPEYAKAYESAAEVYASLGHREELKEVLAEAEKNGVKSVILDAYRYQLDHKPPLRETLERKLEKFRKNYADPLDDGKMAFYEKGLPILTEYLYWFPEAYLLRERALFHRSAGHYEEALADFEKAMTEDHTNFYTLRGMALTYQYMGKYEEALIYMKRAVLCKSTKENWPWLNTELALLYSRLGLHEKALAAYRQYEDEMGEKKCNAYQIRCMARTLARCGKLGEAYEKLAGYYAGEQNPVLKYPSMVDLCQATGRKAEAAGLLEEWSKLLFPRKFQWTNTGQKQYDYRRNYAEYYCYNGWQEALYGDIKEAIRCMGRMRKAMAWERRENGEQPELEDERQGLCDQIFFCILAGEERTGKRAAKALRKWRNKDRLQGVSSYFEADKARLHMELLADYYFADDDKLQAMLDKEDSTETCRHCTYHLCKELEGIRILLLLRQGKRAEAEERLARNLKLQPQDEYLMAIRRHVFPMEK